MGSLAATLSAENLVKYHGDHASRLVVLWHFPPMKTRQSKGTILPTLDTANFCMRILAGVLKIADSTRVAMVEECLYRLQRETEKTSLVCIPSDQLPEDVLNVFRAYQQASIESSDAKVVLVLGACNRERLTGHLTTCSIPFRIGYNGEQVRKIYVNVALQYSDSGALEKVYVCAHYPEYIGRPSPTRVFQLTAVLEFQLAVNFAMLLADADGHDLRFPLMAIAHKRKRDEAEAQDQNTLTSDQISLTSLEHTQATTQQQPELPTK